MQKIVDDYPTRLSEGEMSIERRDPVLWGEQTSTDLLTREELDSYNQDGYLVKRNLFSREEISALSGVAEQLRNLPAETLGGEAIREPGSKELRTLFHLEEHAAIFDTLSRSERIAGIAKRILNDEVYIHQSRLNYKPGFTGKEFYWHSDFETWHAEDGLRRARAVSVSILLTDNTSLNGPLMLMPGSQREFICCQGETPENNHETSLQKQDIGVPSEEQLTAMSEKYGIDHVTGEPGTVIFFDCHTMHGSNGNITPSPRSNAFFVFNAITNRPRSPFAAQRPRPEHLARRNNIASIDIIDAPLI